MKTKIKNYDTEYFIKKFEAIPDDKWITGSLENEPGYCCALGHCGVKNESRLNKEGGALQKLFRDFIGLRVESVNDNNVSYIKNRLLNIDKVKVKANMLSSAILNKPKGRILTALKIIQTAMKPKKIVVHEVHAVPEVPKIAIEEDEDSECEQEIVTTE